MNFQKLLLSYEGRISRQTYWIATAILFGAGIVASFIPLLNIIFWIATIYIYVCLYAKRLHDLGRPGIWQLAMWVPCTLAFVGGIAMFVPVIMGLIGGAQDDEALLAAGLASGGAVGLLLLAGLISLVFHIVLGVLVGQRGPNAYGPDPLNPVDTEVF